MSYVLDGHVHQDPEEPLTIQWQLYIVGIRDVLPALWDVWKDCMHHGKLSLSQSHMQFIDGVSVEALVMVLSIAFARFVRSLGIQAKVVGIGYTDQSRCSSYWWRFETR